MFSNWLEQGVVSRALNREIISINLVDLRPFGLGKHLQVDDYPFGGGPGMVLKPEPLFKAVESIPEAKEGPIILLSPRGKRFDQKVAERLAAGPLLTLIAGHYEGVDARVSDHLVSEEISIGDYVLSCGELPAMVILDAVTRLLPSAIGEQATIEESFSSTMLEYPQYTRPASFRGWEVPAVLLSGNHAEIKQWRRQAAIEHTRMVRPDLVKELAEP